MQLSNCWTASFASSVQSVVLFTCQSRFCLLHLLDSLLLELLKGLQQCWLKRISLKNARLGAKENAKNSCTIGAWRSHPQRHQSRISVYISTSLILAWRITGNHGRIESKPARKHMTAKAWLIHCLSFQASFLIYAAVLILFLPGPLAGGLSLGGATSTSAPANRKKQRMLAHE